MWQFQIRLFVIIVFSCMFVGCGSISPQPQPTASTPPPTTQPQGSIFVAANFPGADCGAKILAADKAADQNGIIQVTQACGTTWTTQVIVGPTHTLSVENGTYQIAHTVLLHDNACLVGQNAVLKMARPIDFVSNADASNANLCVKTIGLSGAPFTGGKSRGIYFLNVHGFTISGVDMEAMVTHGVFIDDGSDSGQILNNTCNGVIQGSCFLIGNGPGFAAVSNITVSNNTISNPHADGIFTVGSKNGLHTNHITISNNVLHCVGDTSIEIGDGVQFATASGNQVSPCIPNATGITVRSAQHVTLENNTSSPSAAGANMIGIFIWNNQGDSQPFQDVTVTQNTVTGYAGLTSSGISWSSFSNSSSDLSITNNTSTGNTNNFFARTNNIANLVFSGNN
jgi:Right handed beta helix region